MNEKSESTDARCLTRSFLSKGGGYRGASLCYRGASLY